MVWIANQLQLEILRPNVTLPELLNYESPHIVTATREVSLTSHSVGVQGSIEGANLLAYPIRIWGRADPRAMIHDTAQLRLVTHPSVCFFIKKSARFSQIFAGSHYGSQSESALTDLAFKIILVSLSSLASGCTHQLDSSPSQPLNLPNRPSDRLSLYKSSNARRVDDGGSLGAVCFEEGLYKTETGIGLTQTIQGCSPVIGPPCLLI